jgi:hypothetical protein
MLAHADTVFGVVPLNKIVPLGESRFFKFFAVQENADKGIDIKLEEILFICLRLNDGFPVYIPLNQPTCHG